MADDFSRVDELLGGFGEFQVVFPKLHLDATGKEKAQCVLYCYWQLERNLPSQSALVPTALPQKLSGAGDVSCPAGSPGNPHRDLNPLPVWVVNFCRLVNACQQLNAEQHFIQIFWDKANCSSLTSFLFRGQCFSKINAIDKKSQSRTHCLIIPLLFQKCPAFTETFAEVANPSRCLGPSS